MDASQRAFIEEHGYMILSSVLDTHQIVELRTMFDTELAKGPPDEKLLAAARSNVYSLKADGSATRPGEVADDNGDPVAAVEDSSRTFHMPLSERGARIFHNETHRSLINPPALMPILEELCGELHWAHTVPSVPVDQRRNVRLDFDQMHYKPPFQEGVADGGGGMHGHPNRLHITCVYEMTSVGPGDGGFACIPGSHHHKFRMPTHSGWRHRWADGSADHATFCVRSPSPGAAYTPVPLLSTDTDTAAAAAAGLVEADRWPVDIPIHRLELQAGDMLLFSERMTHSTVPWRGAGDRRTIFFKYVQRDMAWSAGKLYDEEHADLTDEQRELVRCPEFYYNEGMERGQGQPPTTGPESPWMTWQEAEAKL